MDESMRDYYDTMASVYSHMANIALDNGNKELSDELWEKSWEFDCKANA